MMVMVVVTMTVGEEMIYNGDSRSNETQPKRSGRDEMVHPIFSKK